MLKRFLVPQEHQFYDLFEQAADYAVEAANLLVKLTENYKDADPLSRELGALEHNCDEVAHTVMDRLNKTFITPFDREDIHDMIVTLDDVVDFIEVAAGRMTLYKIDQPTPYAVNLAKQILRGTEKLRAAVHGLRVPKQYESIMRDCIAIHQVENAADDLLHEAIAELFEVQKDPILVIKWKDIYETMETATDCCEDAANVIQNVLVKMA